MKTKRKNEKQFNFKNTIFFAIGLIVIGIVVMNARHSAMQVDSVPVGDRIWNITLSARFTASNESSTLHIAIPSESPFVKVVHQAIKHPNVTLKRPSKLTGYFNEITAVPDLSGEQQLIAEFTVHASDSGHWINKFQRKTDLTPKQRAQFLDDANSLVLNDSLLADALATMRSGVTDLSSLVQEIHNYTHEQIVLAPDLAFSDVPGVLAQMRGNALGKTVAFVALCRAASIPARLVVGVVLKEAIDADLHYWAQVYEDGQWLPYDIEHGYSGELPPNYLALAYDRESISYFEDPTPVETTVDIEAIPAHAGMLGKEKKQFIQIIDLTRLPVTTQQLLAILLILPFGALITQFFRQIVGANSFGTFSAALLALAMVYADWITVVVILSIVGIFGMGGRALISEGLTRVPRLVIVFTLVALSMAFAVSLMEFLNMEPNASAILLPIVILVTLIDRIYATYEDHGLTITLYRIAWTAVIALFCFVLFKMDWLKHLILIHPEIHFFTLATVLLISLYAKPTLMELPALRWLREPEQKNATARKKKTTTEEPSSE
jgi:transglutaminase-like putative cysteine protease